MEQSHEAKRFARQQQRGSVFGEFSFLPVVDKLARFVLFAVASGSVGVCAPRWREMVSGRDGRRQRRPPAAPQIAGVLGVGMPFDASHAAPCIELTGLW